MLVITRTPGEIIRIGDTTTVTIMNVRGASVRMGVAAPKNISVHREEVYKRLVQENRCLVCRDGFVRLVGLGLEGDRDARIYRCAHCQAQHVRYPNPMEHRNEHQTVD